MRDLSGPRSSDRGADSAVELRVSVVRLPARAIVQQRGDRVAWQAEHRMAQHCTSISTSTGLCINIRTVIDDAAWQLYKHACIIVAAMTPTSRAFDRESVGDIVA